jgi:hypothetical protein
MLELMELLKIMRGHRKIESIKGIIQIKYILQKDSLSIANKWILGKKLHIEGSSARSNQT